MKKVLLSALGLMVLLGGIVPAALAQNSSSTPSAPQFNATCMKAAVSTREGSITSSYQTYSAAVQAALQARQSATIAAWDKTSVKDIRNATNGASKTYRAAVKAAEKKLKESKNAAWDKFVSDRKVCGGQGIDKTNKHDD
ncbi:MAG: hypothetical protein V1856_03100 [Candidatus Liptonbacteria bacterium]